MNKKDIIIGETYLLNGYRDIGIYSDIREIIGSEVTILKLNKSGLYSIQSKLNGKIVSVPKINLDKIKE